MPQITITPPSHRTSSQDRRWATSSNSQNPSKVTNSGKCPPEAISTRQKLPATTSIRQSPPTITNARQRLAELIIVYQRLSVPISGG
jgi:hypothetical protein